ncbi:MAG: hypothetical protein II319_01585 [Clostridia bacterium]|nr:hypothetical protein [Clostridia bacterium]
MKRARENRYFPIFPEELRDFDDLRAELNADDAFVALMPAVTFDLFPVYALGCTHASRFTGSNALGKIYFMPIDVADCAIYPKLCDIIRNYYTGFDTKNDDKEKEKLSFFSRFKKRHTETGDKADGLYGIEIEEMMLLDSPDLSASTPLRLSRNCECSAVYFRLLLPNGSTAHLFALCSTPEHTWTSVIEKYNIRTEMIIHSHKGFGHWFTSTPLYDYLCRTKMPHLLPRFYFRGKFITTDDSPTGSSLQEEVADELRGGVCTIYRLPDKL